MANKIPKAQRGILKRFGCVGIGGGCGPSRAERRAERQWNREGRRAERQMRRDERIRKRTPKPTPPPKTGKMPPGEPPSIVKRRVIGSDEEPYRSSPRRGGPTYQSPASFELEKRTEAQAKRGVKVKRMKTGGKSFPDLNKDGRITKADVLVGRGVIKAKRGASASKKKAMKGMSVSKLSNMKSGGSKKKCKYGCK